MSSQEAFLARVRRALHKESPSAASRPPLLWHDHADAAVAAHRMPNARQRAELVARLQQELVAVGGSVACVASAVEAQQYITRLAQAKGVELVVRWQSALLEALEIDAALQQQGITIHTTALPTDAMGDAVTHTATLAARRQELRNLLARADLGLSGVDYIIAETGTLVLLALPGHMRGVSLLPPVHVAVARTEQVLATLADALSMVHAGGADLQQHLTSCLSFVTGPSRTGDIELQLTVGVHGPGELHLVLLDESQTLPCV
jgi:L-lactate dehydrogenase complex protein LldG